MGDQPRAQMHCGCPLNNLTQELSNSDEAFRLQLAELFDEWKLGIAAALERGQAAGTVRSDIDPVAIGTFIVASIEGLAGNAKSSRNYQLVLAAGGVLLEFIGKLKPAPIGQRRWREIDLAGSRTNRFAFVLDQPDCAGHRLRRELPPSPPPRRVPCS